MLRRSNKHRLLPGYLSVCRANVLWFNSQVMVEGGLEATAQENLAMEPSVTVIGTGWDTNSEIPSENINNPSVKNEVALHLNCRNINIEITQEALKLMDVHWLSDRNWSERDTMILLLCCSWAFGSDTGQLAWSMDQLMNGTEKGHCYRWGSDRLALHKMRTASGSERTKGWT